MSEEIEALEQKLGQMKKTQAHEEFVARMGKWGAVQTPFICEECKKNYWVKQEDGVAVSTRCACAGWSVEQQNCQKCGVLVGYHLYVHDYGYEGKTYHKYLKALDYISEHMDWDTPTRYMCENCFNLKAMRLEQKIQSAQASVKSWTKEFGKTQKNLAEAENTLKTLERELDDAKKSWKPKAIHR